MRDFKRGGFRDNKGPGGFRRSGFGRPDRGERFDSGRGRGQMYDAICSQCGKNCQIPFQPTGQRPVYCKECFGGSKSQASGPRRDFESSQKVSDTRIDDLKRQLDSVHSKLDKIVQLLQSQEPQAVSPVVVATVKPASDSAKPVAASKKKSSKKEIASPKKAGPKKK